MFEICCLNDVIIIRETLFRARNGRTETLLDEKIFKYRSENFYESFHKRLFAGLGNQKVQLVAEKSEQPGNEKKIWTCCFTEKSDVRKKIISKQKQSHICKDAGFV